MEGFQMISVHTHCTARRHQGAYYTSAWMSGKCVHRSHRQATHRVDRCNIHTRRDDVFPHISAVHVQPDLRNDLLDGLE